MDTKPRKLSERQISALRHVSEAVTRRLALGMKVAELEAERAKFRTFMDNSPKVAGLPHVSLHGLRRSFGTLAEWVETPAGVTAQIMGHSASALAEKHYRRRPLDLLRMWHDKIEAWLLEQAGIAFDAERAKPGLRAVPAT